MIVSALILMFVGIVKTISIILPPVTIMPDMFNNAWTWFIGFTANLLWTLPGESGRNILAMFNISVIIIGAIYTWKGINWVLNKIRGSGN